MKVRAEGCIGVLLQDRYGLFTSFSSSPPRRIARALMRLRTEKCMAITANYPLSVRRKPADNPRQ